MRRLGNSPSHAALKADAPRRPYTDEEAGKLLRAARDRTDALRWLTWLIAYTGARINELAQLRKEDVKTRTGIPFIGITSSDENGQEIKTSSSRRDVRVDQHLQCGSVLESDD